MFGMGSKTIVGLDVGSSSIKAVELRRTRTGIEVAHLGLEPIAPDIVVDSMIVDSGTVSSARRSSSFPLCSGNGWDKASTLCRRISSSVTLRDRN